jgi:hypothetical protein
MAEYFIDFPTTSTTDLDEWPYYSQGSRAYWGIVVPRLRIILSRYDTQQMTAYAPVRSVGSDGSLVTWDIPCTGEDYNAQIYQYYPYSGARVDFYLQIGNSRFGLAFWIYEHYGESDETRICELVGTVTDYHNQRTLVNMTGAMKITYDATTGLASAYVDGSLVHSATYATGQDCLFGINGRGKEDYGMMCYIHSMTITAGTLSETLYQGDFAGSIEPLEFVSPYDGFLGNSARYDQTYAPQLTDLCPEPASWDPRYTNSDYLWGDGQISSQKNYDLERRFDIYGHLSGRIYMYLDYAVMHGYYPYHIEIEAMNRETGLVELWKFKMYYTTTSGNQYHMTVVEPDGTETTVTQLNTRLLNNQWACMYWEIDEEEDTISWKINNRNVGTVHTITRPFDYDWYRLTKLIRYAPLYSYMVTGAVGWWFRGLAGANDPQMDSHLFCVGMDCTLECTATQWTEKVFNVFRNAIYNPLVPDDPSTIKGMKLTNVDGQGTDMALDSVCVVIDMYKRIYVYMLKQDIGVPEALPHQIPSVRSLTGHYWDLIDVKTANDEERMYSQQCTVQVSLLVPGVCEYDAAADNSKTMVQLVHQGVVNPLYLRAFKVPGQNKISVVASEEISLYEVIVNFLLAT